MVHMKLKSLTLNNMSFIENTKKGLILGTIVLVISSIITSIFLFSIDIKPLFKNTNQISVKYELEK